MGRGKGEEEGEEQGGGGGGWKMMINFLLSRDDQNVTM